MNSHSTLAVVLVLAVVVAAAAAAPSPGPHPGPRTDPEAPAGDYGKHKRQIFREQVNPHTGGKIPEDAFRADRLALNKLQQAGFSVPDGVALHWRGHGHNTATQHDGHGPVGHPDGHSHVQDPHATLIKILQTEDGRYVPTEGQVQNQNTVDSTYLLRTPAGWNQHASHLVGLQRPLGPPLELPGAGGGAAGPPRRPFNPQPNHVHQQAEPSPSPPPQPPPPPPPPPQVHLHPQQNDVNLSPFPSAALQPPPNVPPPSLYHHKLHPLEVPHPPQNLSPSPSLSPTPPAPPPPRKFHPLGGLGGLGGHHHHHHHQLGHSLASLIDIEAQHGPSRDLFGSSLGGFHGLSESGDAALLGDTPSFLLDEDWASELPGGLLSPEQLAALYNSDHEERLQHLHALASF